MKIKDIYNLESKVAVITGADSGIGLCFSRELARRGCTLVMVSNAKESLDAKAIEIATKYNVRTHPVALDLCHPDSATTLVNALAARNLDADILINNAGIFSFKPIIETAARRLDNFIDLHVRAVTQLSSVFAKRFAERKSGCILNMSSMACWAPMPGLAMYSATKAYIRVFTRALNYEMRDYRVNVMAACPGGISTDLFGLPQNLKSLALKLGAIQKPEIFAKKAIDKMLKGKQQYINGWLNRCAIVFVGLTPTKVRMLIKHLLLDKGIKR